MRQFFIILLLNISCISGATVPIPAQNGADAVTQFAFSVKPSGEKQGFLKSFVQKTLQKRLKKAEKAVGSSSRGQWEAIAGFTLGLLSLTAWVVALTYMLNDLSAAAVFGPIGLVLGVAGLILSIIALKRAQGWSSQRASRGLAIAGIIINGLLTLGFIIAAFSA